MRKSHYGFSFIFLDLFFWDHHWLSLWSRVWFVTGNKSRDLYFMCHRILQERVHIPVSPSLAMGSWHVPGNRDFVGLCPRIRRWHQTVVVNRRWTHDAGIGTLVLMPAAKIIPLGVLCCGQSKEAPASAQGCVAIFPELWWPQALPMSFSLWRRLGQVTISPDGEPLIARLSKKQYLLF